MVDDASKGNISLDTDFVKSVFKKVFNIEKEIEKLRNIISYVTLPLGFIPVAGTPIQKLTEEVLTRSMQKKKRESFSWFYFISELTQ